MDGYYVESVICVVLGFLWLLWRRRSLTHLQNLKDSAWKVSQKWKYNLLLVVKYAPYLHFSDLLYYRSNTEAVAQRCSVKKVFLEIWQDSQENTCVSLFFNKIKKRFWYRCFRVNFGKFLRTPFLTEHLWWLLLVIFAGNLRVNKIIRFP